MSMKKDKDKEKGRSYKETGNVVSTKVPGWAYEQLNKFCEEKGTTVFDLLQSIVHAFIRHICRPHDVTPSMQKLIDLLDADVEWQHACNTLAEDRTHIEQLIFVVFQEDREGLRAVMVNEPWRGNPTQTENADEILERVCEVSQRGIYRKLRLIGGRMGLHKTSDILLQLIETQDNVLMEEDLRNEMPQMGENVGARRMEYGNGNVRAPHLSPDSLDDDLRYKYDDEPVELLDWEGSHRQIDPEPPEDMEKEMGFRPIGGEW